MACFFVGGIMKDRSGLNFAGALSIVFIVLKLIGIITWSWWWVLSPIWISMIMVMIVLAILYFADK